MDQVLQGNINRFALPEIFQLIANGRKTGTLGIQKDDDIVMVYFKRGRITYGYGPRQKCHIGQMLRDREKITTSQLDEAVQEQADTAASKRLGQILIEKGYVKRTDLEMVIREQIEELIYSLLSWVSGSFKFYENQYPTSEEITVDLSAENVILEGLRRVDEVNRLKESLPDFKAVLKIATTNREQKLDISLKPDEWNLLARVDGIRSIDQLAEHSGLPRVDALNILAALKLAGLITPAGNQEQTSDPLGQMVDRVAGLLDDYLALRSETTVAAAATEKETEKTN